MEVSNDGGGFGGFIADGFCGAIDNSFFGSIGSFIFGGKLFGGKDITLTGGFGGLTGRIYWAVMTFLFPVFLADLVAL